MKKKVLREVLSKRYNRIKPQPLVKKIHDSNNSSGVSQKDDRCHAPTSSCCQKSEKTNSAHSPISHLPAVSKTAEKFIAQRLQEVIQDLCIIPEEQIGFRIQHSVEHQAL